MKSINYFLLLVVLSGCVGPKTLQRQVNSKTYDPLIVHTSENLKEKSDIKLLFSYSDASNLSDTTLVTKNKGYILPLIILYSWNYDMSVRLGNGSTNPEVIKFMQKTLSEIFQRSGDFKCVLAEEDIDYTATITFKVINVNCDYKRSGFLFGSFGVQSESVDKSHSDIVINLKLIDRNGIVIMDKDYTQQKTMDFIGSSNKQTKVKHDAMQNLVENMTITTELIGKAMVLDINQKLE